MPVANDVCEVSKTRILIELKSISSSSLRAPPLLLYFCRLALQTGQRRAGPASRSDLSSWLRATLADVLH